MRCSNVFLASANKLSEDNHNSLLRIATKEIASFCRDYSLRQMVFFFRVPKVGQGLLLSYVERFWKKMLYL